VYSLNVPIPSAVRDLAADLRPALAGFDRVRESRDRTLVLKRLPAEDRREYLRVERQAREALAGAPAVEAAVTGIGVFRDPPNGPGPVIYLTIESPGLQQLHERLVETLGAVAELEGDGYVPHVTLARGDAEQALDRLRARELDETRFVIDTLEFYDGRHGERIDTLSLPS